MSQFKARQRSDYPFFLSYRTRWSDNDQYLHVNNAAYYLWFDSIVNTYLQEHCGQDPAASPLIGLVISSWCEFFAPVSFPEVVDLGLRVSKLGTSSVSYEVAVYTSRAGVDTPSAVGGYTHVFVERVSRTSAPMTDTTKDGLKKLITTKAKL
ncbi:thioesterase [Mycena amicta]|nr:thioesterase [Mycena amicta]